MNYKEYMQIKDELNEIIIITSHECCITLGKNSQPYEIIAKTNLPIYNSNRGGRATYHDHGQILIYPHIQLKKHNLNLTNYINKLMQWGKNIIEEFGIKTENKNEPGLWVNNEKIGFIGLAIKNGITQHGMAINLYNCEIENFNLILPCNKKQKIGKLFIQKNEFLEKLSKYNPFAINILLK